jgi:hypothetical protein
MKRVLIVVLLAAASVANGQNELRPCNSELRYWDMCRGARGKYEGDWKKGTFNGHGTYSSRLSAAPNDEYAETYVGNWINGLYDGLGTYTVLNRDKVLIKYSGEFKAGAYSGSGTLTLPTGEYAGSWENGKLNGQGSYSRVTGKEKFVQYEGQWLDGKFSGNGTYSFADGRKYVGMFKEGKPEGAGKEISSEGLVRFGNWKDGILIVALQNSEASRSEPATAQSKWLLLATQGNAEAQYHYGMSFILGSGEEVKPRVAIEWLHKAAAQGHENAKKQIVSMFDLGIQMSNLSPSIAVR